ncbi:hypothetical protein V1506DRAFT_493036, partial [Lipomyces tetrasporus]
LENQNGHSTHFCTERLSPHILFDLLNISAVESFLNGWLRAVASPPIINFGYGFVLCVTFTLPPANLSSVLIAV